jgi:hypothetical protein
MTEEAFGRFIVEHQHHVRQVCAGALSRHRLLRLLDDAEQLTWLHAWQGRDDYNPTRPFQPWIATIARRVALDLVRHEYSLRRRLEAVRDRVAGAQPEDGRGAFIRAEALLFVYWSFPPGQRLFLGLVFFSPRAADRSGIGHRRHAARLRVWVASDTPPDNWRAVLQEDEDFCQFIIETASDSAFSPAEACAACEFGQTTAYAIRKRFLTQVRARVSENCQAVEPLSHMI